MAGYGEGRTSFYDLQNEQAAAMKALREEILFNESAEPLDRVIYGMTDTDEYRRECEDMVRRVDAAIGEPIITVGELVRTKSKDPRIFVLDALGGIVKSRIQAKITPNHIDNDESWSRDGFLHVPLRDTMKKVYPVKGSCQLSKETPLLDLFEVTDATFPSPKMLRVGGARAVCHPDDRPLWRMNMKHHVLIGEQEIATYEHYNDTLPMLLEEILGEPLAKREKPEPYIMDC